jgi:hypothetical protein
VRRDCGAGRSNSRREPTRETTCGRRRFARTATSDPVWAPSASRPAHGRPDSRNPGTNRTRVPRTTPGTTNTPAILRADRPGNADMCQGAQARQTPHREATATALQEPVIAGTFHHLDTVFSPTRHALAQSARESTGHDLGDCAPHPHRQCQRARGALTARAPTRGQRRDHRPGRFARPLPPGFGGTWPSNAWPAARDSTAVGDPVSCSTDRSRSPSFARAHEPTP